MAPWMNVFGEKTDLGMANLVVQAGKKGTHVPRSSFKLLQGEKGLASGKKQEEDEQKVGRGKEEKSIGSRERVGGGMLMGVIKPRWETP